LLSLKAVLLSKYRLMKNWWPVCLLLVMTACSDTKPDLTGETPLKAEDFMAAFPSITLPFTASDTNLHKLSDTVTLGYKAFQQFVPDSSLTPVTGTDKKLVIHPVGRIEKENETYLLANFTNRKKQTRLVVFVMDKKKKFMAAKDILDNRANDGYLHTLSINREPTFTIGREKEGKDNNLLYTRAGWIYNDAGLFMVVVNDSNEDPQKAVVINPLDTLPKKNKYSGDYIRDKKNLISLRDNNKPNSYLFFVHFEKNNGTCIGELKGEMTMKDATSARYTDKGDPCIIDFRFEGNKIIIRETGTCGNRRGMKCLFDDTFVKKREARKKK
jgi:hypothetical protein